ncbi:hypothetical protein QR685DRAFT_499256 [Neurospora intermedia]|uniref:Uncharacterized protein n=1 Tax=Neurospora intermedia TaxID=5142 RepID=A0ABR3DCM1_NEUIN
MAHVYGILPPSHHLSSPHRLELLNPETESTWLEESAEYGMVTGSSRTIAEIDSVSAVQQHFRPVLTQTATQTEQHQQTQHIWHFQQSDTEEAYMVLDPREWHIRTIQPGSFNLAEGQRTKGRRPFWILHQLSKHAAAEPTLDPKRVLCVEPVTR